MLYSHLTETDKNLIEYYITHYANESKGKRFIPLEAPLSEVLGEWNRSKVELFNRFGKQFIHSKPIDIEHTRDTLGPMFYNNPIFFDFMRELRDDFTRQYSQEAFTFVGKYEITHRAVYYRLLNLVDIYEYDKFLSTKLSDTCFGDAVKSIKIKVNASGKVYTFNAGEKVMKTIKRLVDMTDNTYCKEHFEEFRIFISQVLNEKTLKGDLCVSIHPLDFITMSDNASNWRSCMKWDGEGCYKAGTVEMMNSHSVVVAYLKSSKDMDIGEGNMWNNKRWRGLYIVGDDFIYSVKGYPYQNESIDTEVLKFLGSIMNKNSDTPRYNTDNIYVENYDYDDGCEVITNTRCIYSFDTEKMYNDIQEWDGEHSYITNIGIGEALPRSELKIVEFCYSGASTCVLCGKYNDSDEEIDLICRDCGEKYVRCTYCRTLMETNEIAYQDEGHSWDGPTILCKCCFEEHHFFDPLNHKLVSDHNAYSLQIIRQTGENEYYSAGSIRLHYDSYDKLVRTWDHEIWNKYFSVPPLRFEYPYYKEIFILEEDLNELGKETFKIYPENKEYKINTDNICNIRRAYYYADQYDL